MKPLLACLLFTSTAFAINPGDTYEKVLAEKGKPKSQAEVGKNRILNYPDVTVQLHDNVVTTIKRLKEPPAARPEAAPPPPPASESTSGSGSTPPAPKGEITQAQIDRIERERLSTINRVKAIVNQKARWYKRTDSMAVSTFSPGWFHEGAITPKFETVDVRTTQDLSAYKSGYITSDLNPGIVWRAEDIEFNPMTKIFYEDRTIPKKRLTQSEMEEINRLYRIIARCDAELKAAHAGDL